MCNIYTIYVIYLELKQVTVKQYALPQRLIVRIKRESEYKAYGDVGVGNGSHLAVTKIKLQNRILGNCYNLGY